MSNSPDQYDLKQKLIASVEPWRDRYGRYLPAGAFAAGVLFDTVALGRIDDTFSLARQGVYLLVIMGFVFFELVGKMPEWMARVRPIGKYKNEIVHFLIGSLLSVFSVFFFKSASLLISFLFYIMLVGLLVANEFSFFRRLGPAVRVTLMSFCLLAYLLYLVPIVWGQLGGVQFAVSIGLTAITIGGLGWSLRKLQVSIQRINRHLYAPSGVLILCFFILYVFKLIPPVPMAIKNIGIFHEVQKLNASYQVVHYRPWWKIWHNGDQDFLAVNGDRVYVFFSVFSPTGFTDQLKVHWLSDRKGNWQTTDRVPVNVSGGRSAGYRGYAFKANFDEGSWQVRIETSDEREIGRIYFDVEKVESIPGERKVITM